MSDSESESSSSSNSSSSSESHSSENSAVAPDTKNVIENNSVETRNTKADVLEKDNDAPNDDKDTPAKSPVVVEGKVDEKVEDRKESTKQMKNDVKRNERNKKSKCKEEKRKEKPQDSDTESSSSTSASSSSDTSSTSGSDTEDEKEKSKPEASATVVKPATVTKKSEIRENSESGKVDELSSVAIEASSKEKVVLEEGELETEVAQEEEQKSPKKPENNEEPTKSEDIITKQSETVNQVSDKDESASKKLAENERDRSPRPPASAPVEERPRRGARSRSRSRSRRRSVSQSKRRRSRSRRRTRSRSRSCSRNRRRRSRSLERSRRSASLKRRREERKRRHANRDREEEDKSKRSRNTPPPKPASTATDNDNATVTDPQAKITERQRRTVDLLTSRTGGAYIPPAKLRMMQAEITDKASAAYQRIAWEALKKSIHGYINKVNVDNIAIITRELLKENIVRGRGLLCRSIIQAQAASPTFTHVYAALVAIINSKFPNIGELLLKRLVIQFKRAFRRNDKAVCLSSSRFVAHLVNQRVAHEILALEILTLLVETPTDDSVEVAIAFLKECGMKLTEVTSKGIGAIFEMLKNILHEGKLDKRVQYMIEVAFQVRKDGFKDHQSVIESLELVEEDDQFTHLLMLDDATNPEDALNAFKFDDKYETNEDKYKGLSKEILGSDASASDNSGSGSESDTESDDSDSDGEGKDEANAAAGDIIDNTETNLIALRRTIYLTINSSLDYEECAHKLMKMQLKPGQEIELCHMFLDCCAEQRTYEKFYGLLAQRFCSINKIYIEPFEEIFRDTYKTTHRLDTNRLRNVSKFFAHLLFTDAISWDVLECIKLNEDDTTSSSRIFIKILFQELAEYMGLGKLNAKLKDEVLTETLAGLFPKDNPRNTRFAINFFTSIGLGGLTDELRRFLKNAPKSVPAINAEILANKPIVADSSSSSSSSSSSTESSSSTSSSSSSSSSDTESSDSDDEKTKKRKKRKQKKKKQVQKKTDEKSKKSKDKKNTKDNSKKKRNNKKHGKKEESSSSSGSSSSSSSNSSSDTESSSTSSEEEKQPRKRKSTKQPVEEAPVAKKSRDASKHNDKVEKRDANNRREYENGNSWEQRGHQYQRNDRNDRHRKDDRDPRERDRSERDRNDRDRNDRDRSDRDRNDRDRDRNERDRDRNERDRDRNDRDRNDRDRGDRDRVERRQQYDRHSDEHGSKEKKRDRESERSKGRSARNTSKERG